MSGPSVFLSPSLITVSYRHWQQFFRRSRPHTCSLICQNFTAAVTMDFYNGDMRSSVIRIFQMPSLKHALMFSHQLNEFPKKTWMTFWPNGDCDHRLKLWQTQGKGILLHQYTNWCSIEAGCPISWASPSTTITKWTFLTRWMLFAVAFSRRRSNSFLTPRLPLFRRACIFLRPSVCNWIFALQFNCTSLVLWYSVTKGKNNSKVDPQMR